MEKAAWSVCHRRSTNHMKAVSAAEQAAFSQTYFLLVAQRGLQPGGGPAETCPVESGEGLERMKRREEVCQQQNGNTA